MVYILTFYNVNIMNTKMNYVIRINDVFKVVIVYRERWNKSLLTFLWYGIKMEYLFEKSNIVFIFVKQTPKNTSE